MIMFLSSMHAHALCLCIRLFAGPSIIIILILHLSVCVCVYERKGHRKLFDPSLKVAFFASLHFNVTNAVD